MAEPITMQQLTDASIDTDSFEVLVNGDENTDVNTRLGETYPSAKKAINTLFTNGGLPAQPFKTKALMTASSLVDGKYAQVTDETANNGLYLKTNGAWVKSSYDPLTQSIAYTDNSLNDVAKGYSQKNLDTSVKLSSYTPIDLIPSKSQNRWVRSAVYQSIVIPVKSGLIYKIKAKSSATPTLLYQLKNFGVDNIDTFVSSNVIEIASSNTVDVTIKTDINYLLVSFKDGPTNLLPEKISIVDEAIIFKSDLTSDINTDSKTSPASASAVKKVNDKLATTEAYLKPFIDKGTEFKPYSSILRSNVAYLPRTSLDVRSANSGVYGVEFALASGDVLEFNYLPMLGTVLWHISSRYIGYPLLTTTARDASTVKKHTFTAYTDMTVQVCSFEKGSIKINGADLNISNAVYLNTFARFQEASYTSDPLYLGYKTTNPVAIKKGDTIKITNVGQGHQPLLARSPLNSNAYFVVQGIAPNNNQNTDLLWVSDSDIDVIMVGTPQSSFFIKKAVTIDNTVNKILEDYQSSNIIPSITDIEMPPLEYVFATHQNFVLKTEVKDGIEQIAISQDVGKTWTYTPNVIGDIVSYHFYSDGTIQLCSPTKVWWTSDYVTFNESTLIDHDGSTFVGYTHHFFNQQNSDTTMFVGDTEIYVWGEYVVNNRYPRIWYSTDLGRTIKCCVKFDTTVMDGIVPRIRHVHDIAQDKDTETFYLTTGDVEQPEYSENYFFSAKYDVATDKFIWKKLGQGYQFKLGKLFFDKVYIYLITDYTSESGLSAQNGIYRVAKQHVGDWSKYRNIYKVNPAEWGSVAPFRLVMDRHGNKVLLLDWIGQGKIWVATEGMDFKKVSISPNVLLSYVIGPNYNGDVYCVTNNLPGDMTTNANLKLSGGTYNLTKALRNAGLRNFMTSNLLSNGLQGLNAY